MPALGLVKDELLCSLLTVLCFPSCQLKKLSYITLTSSACDWLLCAAPGTWPGLPGWLDMVALRRAIAQARCSATSKSN